MNNIGAFASQSLASQGYGGHALGGFRMVQEIACGGMATVYLGHRPGFAGIGQAAAVKIIHSHLARDREFVDMFLDEARIMASVQHPNVCRVLDFGRSEGTYYLAMEYVQGETWADVLHAMRQHAEAQALIPVLLAQILAQVCEGLHAAHEARDERGNPLFVVHRDVSPQNLLIGYDGVARVLDFGVASAAERLHTTRTGAIKGRISFMAPEHARGELVDRRSDVWSLGVVLWEGLARRRLFKRDTDAETILAVTQDTLPSLKDCGYPVPPKLARIAMKALERDPADRYQSAREMGLELARFAAGTPLPFGVAQVSEWMARLFPDQIEQKRAVLQQAARHAELAVPCASDDDSPTTVVEGFRSRELTSRPPASIRSVHEMLDESGEATCLERPYRLPRFSEQSPRPSQPPKTTLVAAVAVLVGVLAGSWFTAALSTPTAHVEESHPLRVRAPAAQALAEPAPVTPAPAFETSRPSAAAPARVAPEGAVTIATPGGWAVVVEGKKRLGIAPGRFVLASGAHVLRLWPAGNRKRQITRVVEISPARQAQLRIALKR